MVAPGESSRQAHHYHSMMTFQWLGTLCAICSKTGLGINTSSANVIFGSHPIVHQFYSQLVLFLGSDFHRSRDHDSDCETECKDSMRKLDPVSSRSNLGCASTLSPLVYCLMSV